MRAISFYVVTLLGVTFSTAVAEEFRFKPAQTNLTEIFLQIAASLEHYGHPAPYLRHMKAEHRRIEAKYEAKFGKKLVSYCPAYMTDDYLNSLIANWDKLAPKLGLEKVAKDSGRIMRLAIDGENGKGTVLILILNQHQKLVSDEMTSQKRQRKFGFEQLKSELVRLHDHGEIPFLAARETALTASEKQDYRALLAKRRFTKADFAQMDRFYAGPWDRLSKYGQSLISARTHAGTRGEDASPFQAQKHAKAFWNEAEDLKLTLSKTTTPAKLQGQISQFLGDVCKVTGQMAQSEFEAGMMKRWLGKQ